MRRSVWFVVVLGCGPSAPSDVAGTSDADDGSSTGSVGTSVEVSSFAESGADETTVGLDPCAPLLPDEGEPSSLIIVVRNDRPDPIFVGWPNPCSLSPIAIQGPDGVDVPVDGPYCTPTCSEVLDLGCQDIACGACAGNGLVWIRPGGEWRIDWPGFYLEAVLPDAGCAEAAACGQECSVYHVPEAGSYTVRAIGFSSCVDESGGECVCRPDDAGACAVLNDAHDFSAPDFEAVASVQIPDEPGVIVSFAP